MTRHLNRANFTKYVTTGSTSVYCQQFAQAFRREDFVKIFRLPANAAPVATPELDADLAAVRPIAEAVL